MSDTGNWKYPGIINPADWHGFVYRIVNNTTGVQYIGKKQFYSVNRKKVKGRKNRKVVRKESNWKAYTGSSKYLNKDIEEIGIENFTFLIESLHETKGSLHYREMEMQVDEDVLRAKLEDNVTRKYYNRMIANIRYLPPEENSKETDYKVSTTLRERCRNTNHHKYDEMNDEEKLQWDLEYKIDKPS